MGEYIRYGNEPVKIGTLENLYYVSMPKFVAAYKTGVLGNAGDGPPSEYVTPDSGFRYRFPFPDEDKLPFGDIIGDYDRGIPVTIDQSLVPDQKYPGETYEMHITQQKFVHRESDGKLCLALIWRDNQGELFRVEDDKEIKGILKSIIKNHITDNPDLQQKTLYREVAARVLKGYRLGTRRMQHLTPTKKIAAPKGIRKGRGLR